VPDTQTLRGLCGAVVGLSAPASPSFLPAPPVCRGLGIVRGVTLPAEGPSKLHVLTPLSSEELEGVDILQVGRLELPKELLQTGRFMSPYLALFSLSASGTGAGAVRSRNNLMRAGQV
jgi:polynucleotide 5'-hydroxyl-kinase GRC3/NOL9